MTDFEEQFAHREELRTAGGAIKFVDIMPSTADLKSPVPLVFASGWAETLELLKGAIQSLVETGRRVIAIDYTELDGILKEVNGLPPSIYMKATAFKKLVEYKKIPKVDIVAHSEGAVNAAVGTLMMPGKVRKLVLVAPGGVMNNDNFYKLTVRFSFSIFIKALLSANSKFARRVAALCIKERIKYIIMNPRQAFQEAIGISNFHITNTLRKIKKQGVELHVIHSKDDGVFPIGESKRVASEVGVDGFHQISGHHHNIFAEPKEFVKIVGDILDAS